jgi:hypothetical protein
MRFVRIVLWLLIVAVSGLLTVGAASRVFRPAAQPAWIDEYDVTAQPPETIAPGTVVERGPPDGWSHLVIKSLPRVRPSEAQHVPTLLGFGRERILRQISWMFTVFAADVVPERQGAHTRYRLRAVGLGLGASVNGRDTVLSVDAAERLGSRLNWVEKETLTKGYAVQQQARVVVHGATFGLVDTPVAFHCGAHNRLVRYRFALLVDPPTGRLDVLAWRLGDADGCADLSRAVLLNPSTIDEAELVPDPSTFNPLPNELSFGVDELPPHRLAVALPPEIAGLVAQTKFTPDEARALETALRKLLP